MTEPAALSRYDIWHTSHRRLAVVAAPRIISAMERRYVDRAVGAAGLRS
jgi:hypothetical protein